MKITTKKNKNIIYIYEIYYNSKTRSVFEFETKEEMLKLDKILYLGLTSNHRANIVEFVYSYCKYRINCNNVTYTNNYKLYI